MYLNAPVSYTTILNQNINVHIVILNSVLWDMGQVHFVISEIRPNRGRYLILVKGLRPIVEEYVDTMHEGTCEMGSVVWRQTPIDRRSWPWL